jgi:hypothetical protein
MQRDHALKVATELSKLINASPTTPTVSAMADVIMEAAGLEGARSEAVTPAMIRAVVEKLGLDFDKIDDPEAWLFVPRVRRLLCKSTTRYSYPDESVDDMRDAQMDLNKRWSAEHRGAKAVRHPRVLSTLEPMGITTIEPLGRDERLQPGEYGHAFRFDPRKIDRTLVLQLICADALLYLGPHVTFDVREAPTDKQGRIGLAWYRDDGDTPTNTDRVSREGWPGNGPPAEWREFRVTGVEG